MSHDDELLECIRRCNEKAAETEAKIAERERLRQLAEKGEGTTEAEAWTAERERLRQLAEPTETNLAQKISLRTATRRMMQVAASKGIVYQGEPIRQLADGLTGTEAKVAADMAERQAQCIPRYGHTVESNPLPLRAWLQHAYEEALDLPIYLRRAIDEIDAKGATP